MSDQTELLPASWQRVAMAETVRRVIGILELGDVPLSKAEVVLVDHIKGMPERMADDFSEAKIGRWLGWVQGVACAKGWLHLDDCKRINKDASDAHAARALPPVKAQAEREGEDAEPVAWQPGEAELARRWAAGLIAKLSTKPDHADDCLWLERIAALSTTTAREAVRVKPLEWVDADEGMCTKWRAAALGGHYELVDFGKDDPGFAVNFHWGRPLSFWFIQGEPDERGPTGPKIFPTLEAAKAAAQADYEARILSALDTGEPSGARLEQV